ncbi:MAG: hypothetical protein WBL80_06785 [Erysipelotrichaceae bacterium]
MGGCTTYGKNTGITAKKAISLYMAYFSDDAGTIEITGYVRPLISWGPVANGACDITGPITIDVPGGQTVRSYGPMTALTGGSLVALHNGGDESYTNAGKYQITTCPLSET